MRKTIINFIIITCCLFIFNIKVEADHGPLVHTCFYNFTGVASDPDFTKDAYLYVEVYEYGTPEVKSVDGRLDRDGGQLYNWGNDDFKKFDAKSTYEARQGAGNQKCLEYLLFDTDFMEDDYIWLDHSQIDSIELDDIESDVNNGITNQPYIFSLIDKVSTTVDKTCKYLDGALNINYDSSGDIVSIYGNGKKVAPLVDMDFKKEFSGCLDLYVCSDVTLSQSADYYLAYSDSFWEMFGLGSDYCKQYQALENRNPENTCIKYDNIYSGNNIHNQRGLLDYAKEYKSCVENSNAACITDVIGKYNAQKDTLRNWCNSIMANVNYGSECLSKCLGLSRDLLALEQQMGLTISYEGDTCSFGANLVLWIGNVIRWLKYIVPVIVIVFGILDFIKATGADKEDEIKKAQRKFVLRLVAAALVFIIPFIIEFILRVFNFDVNGCGIINL